MSVNAQKDRINRRADAHIKQINRHRDKAIKEIKEIANTGVDPIKRGYLLRINGNLCQLTQTDTHEFMIIAVSEGNRYMSGKLTLPGHAISPSSLKEFIYEQGDASDNVEFLGQLERKLTIKDD